ncbi:hypothetical protein FA15DRAFT_668717 [Coprinopsis marcescibilis]|uniref:CUE domain-containing protein n=1 Tax=Coprinopsis marcescibilis TaxID=230819 RepID=A0A5C3KXB8_COPMA|nr:hypothetical protein FA15DRAFT_668717 [Coprinopsis marcescibilis]
MSEPPKSTTPPASEYQQIIITSSSPPPTTSTLAASNDVPVAGLSVAEQLALESFDDDAPSVNLSTRPNSQLSTNNRDAGGDNPLAKAIAPLKAMFPDYDDLILQSVFQSANGNQDAAVDILLGMSDPNYKSEVPPQPALTQTELDEQFARRLMLEEQAQQQQLWAQQQQQQQPILGGRRRNSRQDQEDSHGGPQSAGAASGEKDTMTEIQEQITKAAEVGKKTFGDLFTKVKAKIQEFERGGANPPGPSTQWVGGYDPRAHEQPANYATYQHPQSGSAPSQQQASYYDPNSPITLSPAQTSPPQSIPTPAVKGQDVTPSVASTPPAIAITPQAQQPSSSPSVVPPPNPSPVPIDGGKLGLLPKRPVALIRDPPPEQEQSRRSNDSDDDLEYAENPFDDQKK